MRIPLPNRCIVGQIASVISMLLLISSCVTEKDFLYLNDQIVALNKRVEGLSKEVVSVREQQAKGDVELQKAREDMQGMSGRLDENNRLVRRSVERDTKTQDGTSANLSNLQDRTSRLDTDVKRIKAYLNLEPAAAAPEQEPEEKPLIVAKTKPEPQTPAIRQPDSATEKPEVSSEQQIYERSVALYREEKYEEAISGFKNFVAKYPKSELADNALFWEGESHMALKQYEQAILTFQLVIKNYPKGNKVPNALLRQALAFYEINDKTSSKLLLKKLISQFPKSNEAKIAEGKLKTMK